MENEKKLELKIPERSIEDIKKHIEDNFEWRNGRFVPKIRYPDMFIVDHISLIR